MKSFSIAIAALGAGILVSSYNAFAQTAAILKFSYNGSAGTMAVSNLYDKRTPKKTECTISLFANVHYEGATTAAASKRIVKAKIVKAKRRDFFATALPGVVRGPNNELPVLTLQTRTKCPDAELDIVSNAFARYVDCGVGAEDVTAADFLKKLRSAAKKPSAVRIAATQRLRVDNADGKFCGR